MSLPALAGETNLDCDICVIGSGPAGASIARVLSGSALRVTVVESGDFERRDDADALDEIENIGWPRVMDQWLVRNRIVGGASHSWSGRCVPFDEIDFAPRNWIAGSGWPLKPADLAPYLDAAAPQLGLAAGGFYGPQFWSLAGRARPIADFNPALLHTHFWQFSRDSKKTSEHMRFGQHLAKMLGANITLITQATACRINANADGTAVRSVELAAPGGQRATLAARCIVLCAGGIENARILLCSNNEAPAGLGNQQDLVGRFLMDHIRGPVAQFPISGTAKLRKQFGHYRIKGGHVFAHGMRLSPVAQETEALVNCAAWLEGRITDDDPWNAMKRWMKGKADLRTDSAAIFTNLGLLGNGLKDYFIDRNGLRRKIDRLNLVCMCEQIPDRESRVMLSDVRDQLGLPRARIDWRVHEVERRTLQRMAELVAVEFSRLGLPAPRLEAWARENAGLPDSFRDVAHPAGTTRMGDSPADSVVDTDCKVHGVSGLYIAGSSVFPTSSHANPTLMIVALALRLGDRLRANFAA